MWFWDDGDMWGDNDDPWACERSQGEVWPSDSHRKKEWWEHPVEEWFPADDFSVNPKSPLDLYRKRDAEATVSNWQHFADCARMAEHLRAVVPHIYAPVTLYLVHEITTGRKEKVYYRGRTRIRECGVPSREVVYVAWNRHGLSYNPEIVADRELPTVETGKVISSKSNTASVKITTHWQASAGTYDVVPLERGSLDDWTRKTSMAKVKELAQRLRSAS